MSILSKYAVEVAVSVWLITVAVQYLSRYYLPGLNLDFTHAYLVMLVLILATVGCRGLKGLHSRYRKNRM